MLRELAPAHASAPGKALLAHRPAWRESLLARPLKRHTDRTLTDPRDLNADLERTRHRGHATDHGEHDPQLHALAAPVLRADDAIAALGITLNARGTNDADLDSLAANATSIAHSAQQHPRQRCALAPCRPPPGSAPPGLSATPTLNAATTI
jgi:DNA-binding IclR family transcriptional regulator